MFNSISWTEFFTAAAVVIGIYYAIATLLLYNTEIVAFCRSGFKRTPVVHPPEARSPRRPVMGDARTNDMELIQERTAERLGADIIFAGEDRVPEEAEPVGTAARLALEAVAEELQAELTTVVKLAVDCNSDKVETASLINALLIRYPDVRDSILRPSVNQFITDEVNSSKSFEVDPEEVDVWWNE